MTRSGVCSRTSARSSDAVAGLADDHEAGALEQAREPLAEEHVVVGDDDSGAGRNACVGLSLGGRHPGKYPLASIR